MQKQTKTKSSGPKKPSRARSSAKRAPRAVSGGTALAAAYGSSVRTMFNRRLREMPLIHMEPVKTVVGTTTTALTTIRLNPGLAEFAPWGSGVARNFESFVARSLRVHYVPRAGSTKTGRVVLAIDYDATDSAPASFMQVSNYEDAIPTASWEPTTLIASSRNLQKIKERYVRDEASVADQDIRLTDIGNLYVWVEGQDNTDSIGDIYVDYDLQLFTPQLQESSVGVYGGTVTGGGTMSAANPLGDAAAADAASRGISVDTGSVITFRNVGSYLINYTFTGTVLSGISLSASNCSVTATTATLANSGATVVNRSWLVVCTAANATLDVTVTGTTVTAATVNVASAPVGSLALWEEPRPVSHIGSCPCVGLTLPSEVVNRLCKCPKSQ